MLEIARYSLNFCRKAERGPMRPAWVLRTQVKIIVGENDEADIKTTIMDPNTRTLIRVNIGDIENDMKIFQVLRGASPVDAAARKKMMSEFKINREDIDT